LEYRGDDNTPMYLFREVETGDVNQVTLNGETKVSLNPSDGNP
jgi:hypothetical protein